MNIREHKSHIAGPIAPRHMLARALGVSEGKGCRCAVCGASAFDAALPVMKGLGSNFTDYDLLADSGAQDVCVGCARLMSGRPGDDPPPLRTTSVRVTCASFVTLDQKGWWSIIIGADEVSSGGEVLSWAMSRKRHHWLRAGISTPEWWAIGSDEGTIVWKPNPKVAQCVLNLRHLGATKGAILSGHYPPKFMTKHVAAIDAAECLLRELRGHPILDLIVYAAPQVEVNNEQNEVSDMIDPTDARAAELLANLVWGSEMRADDGKYFWGGYFLRRLRRLRRLPLDTLISRLIEECQVGVSASADVVSTLSTIDQADSEAISKSLRDRTDLVHALAFSRMAEYRKQRKGA